MLPFLPVLMLLLLPGSPTPNVGVAQVRLQIALCALQSELALAEADGEAGDEETPPTTVREHQARTAQASLALRALALLLGDAPLPEHEALPTERLEPVTTVTVSSPPDDPLGRSGFVSAWISRAGPA